MREGEKQTENTDLPVLTHRETETERLRTNSPNTRRAGEKGERERGERLNAKQLVQFASRGATHAPCTLHKHATQQKENKQWILTAATAARGEKRCQREEGKSDIIRNL